MEYKVGQIVYAVIKEKQLILPVKIVEQVITKNLESEQIDYKVLIPNKKNQKVNIEKFENIFKDLDDVNSYLLKKFNESIEKMLEDALTLEDNYFGTNPPKDSSACNIDDNNDKINGNLKVDLGNGVISNVIDNTGLVLNQEVLNQEKEKISDNEENTSA